MAYTKENIEAIVAKSGCCLADLSYLVLNAEKFNTYDVSCALRKMKYINNAINVICRYEPVRGVINANYTIQVISTIVPTQQITLSIAGIIIIDNKTYTGTKCEIATQIAEDINRMVIENQLLGIYNVSAITGSSLDTCNVVFISYGDAVHSREIELEYSVDDIFVSQQVLIPVGIPIPAITETCLTDDNIQFIVEQLNKVCGCCDCQDNDDIIKDITIQE